MRLESLVTLGDKGSPVVMGCALSQAVTGEEMAQALHGATHRNARRRLASRRASSRRRLTERCNRSNGFSGRRVSRRARRNSSTTRVRTAASSGRILPALSPLGERGSIFLRLKRLDSGFRRFPYVSRLRRNGGRLPSRGGVGTRRTRSRFSGRANGSSGSARRPQDGAARLP